MSPPGNTSDDTVVFVQDRRKLLAVGLGCVAFVVLGISCITHPDFWQTARHSRWDVELAGWIGASFCILALIAVSVSLMRPAKVTLEPAGITVSTASETYFRPWNTIDGFKI